MFEIIVSWCKFEFCKDSFGAAIFLCSSGNLCCHVFWCTDISRKDKACKKFNFESSELIQAVRHREPKHMTDPLKIYMYMQKLFAPTISTKTIWHANPVLQKAIEYVQKVDRELSLVEGIQQTEFDSVMSIDATSEKRRNKTAKSSNYNMLSMWTERSLLEKLS